MRIRHSSHDFGWQSSHSVHLAGWQAKMASIEIWIHDVMRTSPIAGEIFLKLPLARGWQSNRCLNVSSLSGLDLIVNLFSFTQYRQK